MELINRAGFDLTGKNAVVLGRSKIVGTPMTRIKSLNLISQKQKKILPNLSDYFITTKFLFLSSIKSNLEFRIPSNDYHMLSHYTTNIIINH